MKWLFKSGKLPSNVKLLDDTSVLIANADYSNRGVYTCEATDETGNIIHSDGVLQILGEYKHEFFLCKILIPDQ